MNATPKQLQSIHAALHRLGLLPHKAEMISSYTGNRSSSSRDMTMEEAAAMLADLNAQQGRQQQAHDGRERMIKKIIAMAREMGVIRRQQVIKPGGEMELKSDYSAFNKWLLEKSCLKKQKLNDVTDAELPRLVTQYKNIYKDFLRRYH